jgi:hypothetical protein
MAKRKDSVALFEVITATKRKEAAAAAAPREPGARASKWWFKSRSRNADACVMAAPDRSHDPNDPTAGVVLTPVYAPAQFVTPVTPAVYQPSPQEEPPAPAVVQRVIPATYAAPAERVAPAAQPSSAAVEIPSAARPRRAWFGFGIKKLGLDPDRQEVTLRFRYTTAIVAGFAVLVIVGLAYVSGRRSKAVAGPNSRSTEEIQRGDILGKVLEIETDRVTTMDPPAAAAEDRALPEVGRPTGGGSAVVPPAGVAPKPPASPAKGNAAFEDGLPRTMSLNYVIIQSYPRREDAEAARQALDAAGIPCTVEPTPKDWSANPKLWSVIGTRGFHRIKKVAEYQAYLNAIMAVNERFAVKNKYRKFEPAPRKWQ